MAVINTNLLSLTTQNNLNKSQSSTGTRSSVCPLVCVSTVQKMTLLAGQLLTV